MMLSSFAPTPERCAASGRRIKQFTRQSVLDREPEPVRPKAAAASKRPCKCGRADSHGQPYMAGPENGPCWKCLRELYPNPDMDELDLLCRSGTQRPRIVADIRRLLAADLDFEEIADRLRIDVVDIENLAFRWLKRKGAGR